MILRDDVVLKSALSVQSRNWVVKACKCVSLMGRVSVVNFSLETSHGHLWKHVGVFLIRIRTSVMVSCGLEDVIEWWTIGFMEVCALSAFLVLTSLVETF